MLFQLCNKTHRYSYLCGYIYVLKIISTIIITTALLTRFNTKLRNTKIAEWTTNYSHMRANFTDRCKNERHNKSK